MDANLKRKAIWKNLLVLSAVITLNYVSYNGLQNLQSSLHRDQGMGTISTSSRYVAFTLSSLFFSTVMIRVCGQKWTVTISLGSFLIWIAANGVGIWATMIPASIIGGLFSAPLWTAQGSYVTELAKEYAEITKQGTDKITTLFIGVFGAIYAFAPIISDTISNTILKKSVPVNYTEPTPEDIEEYCGINDCPWIESNSTLFEDPPASIVWTLVGIYAVFVVAAIIVSILFLDPLPKLVNVRAKGKMKDEIIIGLLAPLKLMRNYRLWLLVPINCYSSIMQSFRVAEYNGSWVTCALGIWMVGLVNIPGNIVMSPTNFLTGYVSKSIGRVIPIIFSSTVGLLVFLSLLLWNINVEDSWVFYTLSMGFGLSEGILDTIVQAAHGFVFPNDASASFAAYNFFWCITAAITYGYSYYICSDIKLYIVLFLLFIGFIVYMVLEWDMYNTKTVEIKDYVLDVEPKISSESTSHNKANYEMNTKF